jgi:glutathione S-transferase
MVESLAFFGGDRNTSEPSLIAWLALRKAGAVFQEQWLEEDSPLVERVSPNGRLPVLIHQGELVWDALGIAEYANETLAKGGLWPAQVVARAQARSVVGELHSGLQCVRDALPLDCKSQGAVLDLPAEVEQELIRLGAIWRHCLTKSKGPWLFGALSLADIWSAPMVFRLRTYGLKMGALEQSYVRTTLSDADVRAWLAACLGPAAK